jgi:glucose/arabinose dehydrogenase
LFIIEKRPYRTLLLILVILEVRRNIISNFNCISFKLSLEFLNSTALGPKYAYNLFVGDINNGNLYFFELNKNRTAFELYDNDLEELTDQVADDDQELSEIVFAIGFEEGITDVETGPDGFLYILTFNGSIYRILPVTDENRQD